MFSVPKFTREELINLNYHKPSIDEMIRRVKVYMTSRRFTFIDEDGKIKDVPGTVKEQPKEIKTETQKILKTTPQKITPQKIIPKQVFKSKTIVRLKNKPKQNINQQNNVLVKSVPSVPKNISSVKNVSSVKSVPSVSKNISLVKNVSSIKKQQRNLPKLPICRMNVRPSQPKETIVQKPITQEPIKSQKTYVRTITIKHRNGKIEIRKERLDHNKKIIQ